MTGFAGTGALVRLILRRDRFTLPIWILLVGVVPIAIAASFAELYPTAEALRAYAEENMRTPATVATLGLIFNSTLGGLVAWRTGLQSTILIAPVSILWIIRHTRVEEEAGRSELLGSTVVGRFAPLTAALAVVFGANFLIGVIIAIGLIGQGLPFAGSIALGMSAMAVGWLFAAVAAVAAQLTASPGAARGIALGTYAFFYVLRIVGDAGGENGASYFLSWLSPVGWARLTRAFANEQWWVFGLFLLATLVLAAAAYGLSARRDLGEGLLPARLGPATAATSLNSPLALAWRLHRGTLLGWTAGALLIGGLLGSVGVSISKFTDVPQMQSWVQSMGATNAGDAFLFIIMYVLGQVISAYAITVVLGMRDEEDKGRADPILTTPVSRLRWAVSHLVFAILGPALILVVLGLMIGLGYGVSAGNVGGELPRLVVRTLVTLPAVWVMAGIAALLYGFLPRFATAATWGLLALFLALELGWELQQISQAVFDLSPFAYVHWSLPVNIIPLIALTGVAALLTAAGMVGLRRRDLG